MEYLPTDLPKYMKTTSREAVANSPVEAGHVLLFSEDGTSLTAKKSDGSFESVGGGSGGGMDFYKCSAINTSTTARPEGYTLKLHCVNAENPSDTLDYNFTMVDAGATGGNRTWQDTTVELSATQVFNGNNGSVMTWIISKIGESPTIVLQTVENSAKNNPWEITQLKSPSTGKTYNATWTLSAAADAATGGAPAGLTLGFHAVCQMDGMTPETADLSFTMEDTAKTGWERTWLSSDGTLRLQAKVYIEQTPGSDVDDSARTWFITSSSNSSTNVWEADNQGGADGPANPWGMSTMMYDENGMDYNLTWTVSEAVAPDGTWSGYKAVLTDGGYVFSETSTAGLRYQGGFTPQVGTIYSHDAKVKVAQLMEATVAIPQDGLVFWMPFDGSIEPRIGKVSAVGSTDTITYGNRAGVKYAILDRSCRWNMLDADGALFPQLSTSAVSIIVYVNMVDVNFNYICRLMPIGANNYKLIGRTSGSNWEVGGSSSSNTDCSPNKWHFVCFRQTSFNKSDGTNGEARIDTVTYQSHGSLAGNNQYMMLCGSNENGYDYKGSIFDFAIYNRYLTDAEVEALYQRVIPLQA